MAGSCPDKQRKHHIPKLETLHGSLPGAVDDGDGISVIYNFPQANAVDMWDGNPEYYKVTNEQKRCNLMGVTLTLRKMKYFHIEIHING